MEEGRREGIKEGREEGLKQGIEKGIYKKAIETAKNMLSKNLDINLISECTGISVEELKNLN